MYSLREVIDEARAQKVAVGHFNFCTIDGLWAIFRAAKNVGVPVLAGVSEGERDFVGVRQAAALVKSIREEYDFPIYLNADHTYSLERVKEVVAAGYDSVTFDGAQLPLDHNISRTREVVEYVKNERPSMLVEGEVGYIGTSSMLLDEIPKGAAVSGLSLTTSEEAKRFVKETSVDMFAPAVGNIHGMLKSGGEPALDIPRIGDISNASGVPLVLHGGSGTSDADFVKAIDAGVAVVHINTEMRLAWRDGLVSVLKEATNEVAPYKLLKSSMTGMQDIIEHRLKLFSKK